MTLMTNHPTPQDHKEAAETPTLQGFAGYMTHDSFSTASSPTAVREEYRRLSRQQLEGLERRLGERDKQALAAIQRHRYLLTSQVQRLYFTESSTQSAALRATSRALKKLKEFGLIDHLARRIGGVRAGSGALIWYLTHAGERLLRLNTKNASPIKRFFEPSPLFLAHTLAVADIAIQIAELCREQYSPKLTLLQTEPECWRVYSEYGNMLSLKPDLFAITTSGQYEDRWFVEVDLDTESPSKIVEKCERYHKYYRSGLEQQEAEVFPLTVWIVPTTERKEKLLRCIREAFEKQRKLFVVITGNELRSLICQGGEEDSLC